MLDRSKYRQRYFQERQRQLPADRHVRAAKMGAMAKARTDQENTPLGAPPKPVDVRSVYDTRPVNAFDFNISASASVNSASTAAVMFFNVPEGFVGILRNFDIWFEPNPVSALRSGFEWSLQLNGGDYPYNLNVPFGIAVDRETCFMIANEFNTIGVRVTLGTAAEFTSGDVFARFYGNFLLKSGLPASLEIGNLVPASAIRPKAPRSMPPPPKAPPPVPPSPPRVPSDAELQARMRAARQQHFQSQQPLYSATSTKKR